MGSCFRLPTIKVLQLIFSVACLTLHTLSLQPEDTPGHSFLLSITFGTFVVIELGVAIGHLTDEPVPCMVDALYSVVGSALYVASGVASLRFWEDEPREVRVVRLGLWTGLVSCVSSVLYLLDAFFAIRGSDICAGESIYIVD